MITRSLLFRSLLFALPWTASLLGIAVAAPTGRAAQLSLGASYSDTTPLEHAGTSLGETSITSLQVGVEMSSRLGAERRLTYGVRYENFGFDRDARVPLPDELQGAALSLGFVTPLSAGWTGRLTLRSGFYGTSLALSSREFNVPVVALASFCQHETLAWSVGLRYDAWSRYQLLPIAGINWQFARDWEFAIGLPRTGIAWQIHPHATLRVGATFQGGTFHLADDPRAAAPLAGTPWLGRTKLDYREIRTGVALELLSARSLSVVFDVGTIVSQRFDYRRRDYRLSADAAGYVALSARAGF